MRRVGATLLGIVFLTCCQWPTARDDSNPTSPGLANSIRPVAAAATLTSDEAFAAEVREAFLHAWSAYREHAWGHDALLPLSRGHRDWYDVSLLMTPLDAFDTMLLMGRR